MEEEEISDALYGDLGDFEFNQKLKEQKDEVASLTERLRQSVVTITDLQNEVKRLQKENRQLKKNLSSLMLTAQTELDRKVREIATLKQKHDNRIFRRKNNQCAGIQTDVTIHPFFQSKVNGSNVNGDEQSIIEKCTQITFVTEDKSTTSSNTRNGLNNFRIPKKNLFTRHVDEPTREPIYPGQSTERLENVKIVANDHKKRDNLPKKNSHARRLDIDEERSQNPRSSRIENDTEKSKPRGPRHDMKDSRRHSPAGFVSNRLERDYNKPAASDHHSRYRHTNGNRRKHSRDRGSEERDRHSKRLRSNSNPYRERSKSRTSRNEDKHRQSKSPKKSRSRSRKDDRINDVAKDSILDMKEKELEAMLIEQTKILQEIGKDDKEQRAVKDNLSTQRHKRKMSNNEDSREKTTDQGETKDTINCAVIPNIESICVSDHTSLQLAEVDSGCNRDQNNLQEVDIEPENAKAPNIETNLNQELPPVEVVPETNLELPSLVQALVSSPIEEQPKMTEKNDEATVTIENKLQSNENSNSQMDIDYELMGLTSIGDHFDPISEEINKQSLIESSSNMNCPTVNEDTIPDLPSTQINASFITIESNVREEGEVAKNNLNGSFERHKLSKSCEYTVQDDGNEVCIYLTKKRKKHKKAKVTS